MILKKTKTRKELLIMRKRDRQKLRQLQSELERAKDEIEHLKGLVRKKPPKQKIRHVHTGSDRCPICRYDGKDHSLDRF